MNQIVKVSIAGLIALTAVYSDAQENTLSSLIFLVDKSLSKDKTFIINGDKYALEKPWLKEDSDFYQNIIVTRKQYKINLPGPISSVTVTTNSDHPTYLRISPYIIYGKISGVQITSWSGRPDAEVEKTVEYLQENGFKEAITPVRFDVFGDTISLFPDTPWALPPMPYPSPTITPSPSPVPK